MGQALKSATTTTDLDAVVDGILKASGGNFREAILGLVRGQYQIEAEALARTSAGYVRRELVK